MQLREQYQKKIVPEMMKAFGYKNMLAVPRVTKIVINVGLSRALKDKTFIEAALSTLSRISGQKAIQTKAKKSISNFKIREGMVVGAKVTLRGKRMYDFLEKLVHVTLPRTRDFHGLDPKKGFDEHGNYSLGFREHIVFPEIGSDEVERLHGLEISLATTARSADETRTLLSLLGFPFKQ